MGTGPLDHPRLLEIEEKLNHAELDAAQRLLAELGDAPVHRTAITYFATRLLYQRGRLDAPGVIERLRELVRATPAFPQAQAMLNAAESGTLRPDPEGFLLATAPPQQRASPAARLLPDLDLVAAPAPGDSPRAEPALALPREPARVEVTLAEAPAIDVPPARSSGAHRVPSLAIPRPPILPTFSDPPDRQPSYVPAGEHLELGDELRLELPRQTLRGPGPAASAVARPSLRSLPSETRRPRRPAPKQDADLPPATPLSIATKLDQADFQGALAEIARIESAATPELTLLHVRALIGSGAREQALTELERLEHAPLLEPDLRGGAARLLIELGEPRRALAQARRAYADDPEPALGRLTLAWALVRSARRTPNHEAIDEADQLLHALRARRGPIPELVQALRACVLAERGDPERAISAAQLALGLDSRSVDALAAISIASARLSRHADAQKAWLRLLEANPEEADWLGDRLEQQGVPLAEMTPAAAPPRHDSSASRLWDSAELELTGGDRERAIQVFEQEAARELRGLVGDSATDAIPLLATMAANFLTGAPLFRHFAPYDLSLWSIARVEAALDTLYGRAPRPALVSDDFPARVMLATYLGECLRMAFDGKWVGALAVPDEVVVEAGETKWEPFRELRARMQQGKKLYFDMPGLHHPATEPFAHRVRVRVEPPCPWDPAVWPSPHMLPRLARAFAGSVVGKYCAEFAEGPLDRSLSGLSAIDSYVALVAPPKAPPSRSERWAERVSVLVGAYLGEVLCDALGAHWAEGAKAASGAESYVLELPDGSTTCPVQQAFERLTGKRLTPLSEYASRLARAGSAR